MTSDEEQVLSDLDLALMLYHGGLIRDATEDELKESRRRLEDLGLLNSTFYDELPDDAELTARGNNHLDYLLSRPLPVLRNRWVHDNE